MTREEKQLLLKDLCAGLPYGVKGFIDGFGTVHLKGHANFVADDIAIEHNGDVSWIEVNYFKPYLRPMSSMTEEEENEYRTINCYEGLFPHNEDALDYVLSHHFDFRGLIPMGLALEAPEGMYKNE